MSHTQTVPSAFSQQHRCMPYDRFTVGRIKLVPTSAKPVSRPLRATAGAPRPSCSDSFLHKSSLLQIQATLPHIPSEASPHEDDAAAAARAGQWRLEDEVLWSFHDCVW